MSNCYEINIENIETQLNSHDSFIGGVPKLPLCVVFPKCKFCDNEQTFFFQLKFPKKHAWNGFSIAIFSCTSCENENHLIPRMPKGLLFGANLSKKFFSQYETNFKFIVFKSVKAVLRTDYVVKIKFKEICLVETNCSLASNNRVGGRPQWYLENESPGTYENNIEMIFLFQLAQGAQFEILETAPRQVELSFFGEPEVSPNNYYELFISNELYFFGVNDISNPYVYVTSQI